MHFGNTVWKRLFSRRKWVLRTAHSWLRLPGGWGGGLLHRMCAALPKKQTSRDFRELPAALYSRLLYSASPRERMFWFWDAHWVRRAFAHANGNVYANHPWQQLRHQVLPSSVLAKWPYGMRDRAESKNFVTCIARGSAARQRAMTVFVFRPATRHCAVWSTEYWGELRQRAAAVCSRSEGVLYRRYGLQLVECVCQLRSRHYPLSLFAKQVRQPGSQDGRGGYRPQLRAAN